MYFAHGGNEIARGLNLIRLARLLRNRRFQRIYILDRTTRPAVAAWLAGIPERIGIDLGAQQHWITNAGIGRQYFHAHPISLMSQLMASKGLPLMSTEPDLLVPARATADIDIDSRFGRLPRPWVVLGLGASHADKDWPDEHWRKLLQDLRQVSSATMIVTGGSSRQTRADRIIAEAGVDAINACGLSIMKAAALLKLADLFAGADSGALNLAAAVGTEAYGVRAHACTAVQSAHSHRARIGRSLTQMSEIAPERLASMLLTRLQVLQNQHNRQMVLTLR